MNKKVLVTGGAGYIGSHVVRQLGEAGYEVVVYDNCSTGSPKAVLYGDLIIGDLGDLNLLNEVFIKHQFSAVLHFAASLSVPESVAYPLNYYTNNTRNTLNLLYCCRVTAVDQIIFSSTAAVYGQPTENPVTESAPTLPINPYGRSKLSCEWFIRDYSAASSLRYVILRYFNVAGADSSGRLGQMSKDASHLIRVACDAALKRRPEVRIFGTDFPTPDGTGIRDYIHVEDLAAAHLDALRYLEQGHESQILNCGYGQGYSVRQVIKYVKEISGVDFPVIETERRLGDPACVTASADKIYKVLGWRPRYNHLDKIVYTTLAWEKLRQEKEISMLDFFSVNT
ncbi:UDP-glucose 4-epimerase GalE [Aetokthonos hydrillicola Thurmond2011]|jgi:UDP-glucose 4-epimerase|uniref:UDP-glucose 4-epimerase n=1 Tax=Aetokthonos hydrillicola Thurmond2011 TaxID=2712845 RepID=A0AAP5IE85_9CYAN|nr:UDP-glucose 4-epimerase GalE [Aetokthonos hydrillicola]MBO3463839.1 UDP-glucose 4-epimerase GalE [Aetokthonos hydrillicola CCALA 1050]MBW4589189.1 UDP-glucose 4-epimerase GalE [Aetokthonos hydrillicola CCALA 1050]MDR9898749.1 UDP-glucose 4-epimerase GalE [Aetokthonos hydrillicola Thurmond2011]